MKKFLRLVSLMCILAVLAGCSLVGTVEEEEKVNEPKSETVLTIDGTEFNLERFNLYYYSAQDEILAAAGYQNSTDIPDDFWKQKVDGKTNLERAKDDALANLINDGLGYLKAKELGVELTAEEKSQIANQIAALKQDQMSTEQFKTIGISEKEMEAYYTEMFHMTHILPALIDNGHLKVDENEVLVALNESYVKAKHILRFTIDPNTNQPLSDDKIAEVEKEANDILNKVKAGEDFDKLMKEFNEDTGMATAPDGYVFTTGEMVPEFEEAAFALKENEVSDIVQTTYGLHIIKRIPFDLEGEQEIKAMEAIKSQLVMPDYEELVKVWKSKAKIKIEQDIIDGLKPTIVKN